MWWIIVLLCLIIYSFFLAAKEPSVLIQVFAMNSALVCEIVTLVIMGRKLD